MNANDLTEAAEAPAVADTPLAWSAAQTGMWPTADYPPTGSFPEPKQPWHSAISVATLMGVLASLLAAAIVVWGFVAPPLESGSTAAPTSPAPALEVPPVATPQFVIPTAVAQHKDDPDTVFLTAVKRDYAAAPDAPPRVITGDTATIEYGHQLCAYMQQYPVSATSRASAVTWFRQQYILSNAQAWAYVNAAAQAYCPEFP